MKFIALEHRTVLGVSGPDRASFLQGLISNDIRRVDARHAIYAAVLTPQGKYLHDFFVVGMDAALLIETEAARRGELLRRLALYRLRSDVRLEDLDDCYAVFAIVTDQPGSRLGAALGLEPGAAGEARPLGDEGVIWIDPRHPAIGARALLLRSAGTAPLEAMGLAPGQLETYEAQRLALGLPDGSRDLLVDKTLLLEAGFDTFNGIDWNKGCYLGQEVTARTRYRGLVKKRFVPVEVEGPLPPAGTPILSDEGGEAGEIRSGLGGRAIAVLRSEYLERPGVMLRAGSATVHPPQVISRDDAPTADATGRPT